MGLNGGMRTLSAKVHSSSLQSQPSSFHSVAQISNGREIERKLQSHEVPNTCAVGQSVGLMEGDQVAETYCKFVFNY